MDQPKCVRANTSFHLGNSTKERHGWASQTDSLYRLSLNHTSGFSRQGQADQDEGDRERGSDRKADQGSQGEST